VIDDVYKIATNDVKGENEVKRVSRKLGLSEFESVLDFYSINAFSSFMKVLNLMFISINGPSVADFNPRPYVKIWLKDHRSAVSDLRGKERKESNDQNKWQKMFFTIVFY
jgi:hypothetical protein